MNGTYNKYNMGSNMIFNTVETKKNKSLQDIVKNICIDDIKNLICFELRKEGITGKQYEARFNMEVQFLKDELINQGYRIYDPSDKDKEIEHLNLIISTLETSNKQLRDMLYK